VALLQQEGGNGRRVDTSGHGDGNEAALGYGALGESVELGRWAHGDNFILPDSAPSRKNEERFLASLEMTE
jgi:hypothetical protein